MGDFYNALKAESKKHKRANLESFQTMNVPGFERKSDNHWQLNLNGHTLDYWPSTSKWRYQGKTIRGNTKNLLAFINKRRK